jgi:hypothetical protein
MAFRAPGSVKVPAMLALLLGAASAARAQQTIFNVPSPDVLDRRAVYLETDQYLRWWDADDAAFSVLRGVFGAGHDMEVGFNLGALDDLHRSEPFLDAALKWKPWVHPFHHESTDGTLGFILGANSGVGLRGGSAGNFRSLAYGAACFDLTATGTRISAGPFGATRDVFTDARRAGLQVTFEQRLARVKGLTLAADWFSGEGAAMTTGLIWTRGRFVAYAGYGFANDGRNADLVTLELGVNLPPRR